MKKIKKQNNKLIEGTLNANIVKVRTEYEVEVNGFQMTIFIERDGRLTLNPLWGDDFVFKKSNPEMVKKAAEAFFIAHSLSKEVLK